MLDVTTQQLITVPMGKELVAELNSALRSVGYTNRSQFIRDAIVEKLKREGVEIPDWMAVPEPKHKMPDQSGKRGGPSEATADKSSKTPMIVESALSALSRGQSGRPVFAEEENPFVADERNRPSPPVSSGSGPGRRDPAGLPPAPGAGESGSGSKALRGQKIQDGGIQGLSPANTIAVQGSTADVARKAREERMDRAARVQRGSGPKTTAASTTGSKSGRTAPPRPKSGQQ